ncbi:hypothetical protein [Absidia glauca]|uniref:Uncharacterized protein n=1 Tax=Absidia glauca TaxID=4829 RepID=A0A168Q2Z2_ABSGL|nr:hypothetical protein [Absidia glauca]
MVFPTVSYSTKINAKFSAHKKFKLSTPRVGPRSAPDIYDRISAYDRAFHKCMQKDSKLAQWRQRMERKGLPAPLRDGYQRSSSSWQHSLSSLSSGASTCSNESYTLHRTKNVYDIKPMRSITTATTTTTNCPPPLVAPSPRPSCHAKSTTND